MLNDCSEFTWPLSEIREVSVTDLSFLAVSGVYELDGCYMYIYIYDITKCWLGFHKLDVGIYGWAVPPRIIHSDREGGLHITDVAHQIPYGYSPKGGSILPLYGTQLPYYM